MITNKQLNSDYNNIVKAAEKLQKLGSYNDALELLELASTLAYNYNFIESFSDRKIESLINLISLESFKPLNISGSDNKVMFYDYFGYDNRGLTQQYLRALMHLNFEIVYVLEKQGHSSYAETILAELSEYSKTSVYILAGHTHLQKIEEILQICESEKPSKVLLHLAPWDVVAVAAFSIITGIKRYQINLTDHAFWLGTGITDISLEFRSFGVTLSMRSRGIGEDKIRMLPYYPIINNIPFKGFPIDVEGKLTIFAGAAAYKILGERMEFLHLVKKVLQIDERLVFIFAGGGNLESVRKFIKENELENRFILVGDRQDISAVVKQCNYFFSTYPITGALMSQIAAHNGIPSFYYSSDKFPINDLGELFYKIPPGSLEKFNSIDDLVDKFSKVYNDPSWLSSYGKILEMSMIEPDEFAEHLSLIFSGADPFKKNQIEFDISSHFSSLNAFLLESENNYNKKYDSIILSKLPNFKSRSKILPRYFIKDQIKSFRTSKKNFIKNFFLLTTPLKKLAE